MSICSVSAVPKSREGLSPPVLTFPSFQVLENPVLLSKRGRTWGLLHYGDPTGVYPLPTSLQYTLNKYLLHILPSPILQSGSNCTSVCQQEASSVGVGWEEGWEAGVLWCLWAAGQALQAMSNPQKSVPITIWPIGAVHHHHEAWRAKKSHPFICHGVCY